MREIYIDAFKVPQVRVCCTQELCSGSIIRNEARSPPKVRSSFSSSFQSARKNSGRGTDGKKEFDAKRDLVCGRQSTEAVIRCLADAIWCANREATSRSPFRITQTNKPPRVFSAALKRFP